MALRWARALLALLLLMALGSYLTAQYTRLDEQPPPAAESSSPSLVVIGILGVLALLALRGLQVVVMRAMDKGTDTP